ncbi:hypothetical protein J1N35_022792 [Gossypium stocksii]|uniref:Uncharacterized protein n=1 Tax=Gossypium stocksii TaxID=47602 RepID=A0A9D4A1H2_9ROSI|nr:hypothetical protein J1N35_022792 [Gossypium stocksii]
MSRDGEKVLENKGPINKASIERMTHDKDMPILKEAEIRKIRKGKTKADSKGTNLNAETSLWRKMKDVKKMVNSINNRWIRLVAKIKDIEKSQNLFYAYTKVWNSSIVAILSQLSPSPLLKFLMFPLIIRNYELLSADDDLEDRDRSVASPLIVQVSDSNKEEKFSDIKECLQKIDSLFEEVTFNDQEDIVVEKEVAVTEEEVFTKEEEVAENKKKKEKEDFVVNIVIAPESVDANINNLE